MLTPYFEISQSDTEVFLKIKAPLANISQTELHVDGDTVIFYSSPYYLRVILPGQIREDSASSGQYDSDSGEFRFRLFKVIDGEYFEDLDMIGRLLEPRKKKTGDKPAIEVIGESVFSSDSDSNDENDWFIPQKTPEKNLELLAGFRYGFANKNTGLMNEIRDEFYEILDLIGTEQKSNAERTFLKESEETTKFSADHYLADLMEPEEIEPLIKYVPPWEEKLEKEERVELTQEEKNTLKNLGNRDYMLDSSEKRTVLLSLVDILFAYAYNHRITMGENTVESAWTINKISSTLSWFQNFQNMKEVKISCVRRSLIYPLYRNWELSLAVLKDTLNILRLGRRQVLKCLIEIHTLFNSSEPRYLLNQLYITDYCIWVQKCSEKRMTNLAHNFERVDVLKDDLGLDLDELETAAHIVQEEEVDREISRRLSQIAVNSSDESEDNESLGSESDSSRSTLVSTSSWESSEDSGEVSDSESDEFSTNEEE